MVCSFVLLPAQRGSIDSSDAVLFQQSGQRSLANPLSRARRRQALPKVECPGRRGVGGHRGEELGAVAAELLPHPVREARPVPRQVLAEPRPVGQFNDRRVGRFQASQAMRVGPQGGGENPRIPAIILRTRRREAVPEAVELFLG